MSKEKPWQDLPRPWVADIGSGGAPAPFANILVDKYPGEGYPHRNVRLQVGPGQLFIEADAHQLPFGDGELDYVWTCDLLEHVERPDVVVSEMCRVASKGSILMPSVGLEGFIQMVDEGKRSNGHSWLCRSEGPGTLGFLRCNNADKSVVRDLLQRLNYWPTVSRLCYNANIFHAWGWGGWRPTVRVHVYDPTTEVVANWAGQFLFLGGQPQ